MSNIHDDAISDYIQDNETDLFLDWLESKDDPVDDILDLVIRNNKLREKFMAWATQEATDRLSAVPERDNEFDLGEKEDSEIA